MDVVFIMEQCNQSSGEHGTAYVENGRLYCPDVSQDDLDAAMADYDHEAWMRSQETLSNVERKRLKASRDIEKLAPSWKQRNLIARALVMIATHLGIEDSPEADDLMKLWKEIDRLRRKSNDPLL